MPMASLDCHLTLVSLLLCLTVVASVTDVRDMSIDEYINFINPPAVHKFQNQYGDSILCVAYNDQISLEGLEQRSTKPMYDRNDRKMKSVDDRKMKSGLNFSSYGVKTNCPEGTVAVMETKREQVERARSVADFISKKRNIAHSSKGLDDNNAQHEYGVARFETTDRIAGAEAALNVWQPDVDTDDGIFSLSQIWVVHMGDDIESVEAGWMVFPELFGDFSTRFFLFWTADSYGNTGCYNTLCAGFVLAPDAPLYPGATLKPLSQYNGNQLQMVLAIIKETVDGNNTRWSLYLADKLIGWWPSSLFKDLASMANRAEFGGEVAYSPAPSGSPFTRTQMGSGHFPYEGFSRAANILDIHIFGEHGVLIDNLPGTLYRGRPNCYDVTFVTDKKADTHIFFGGPGGYNVDCVV